MGCRFESDRGHLLVHPSIFPLWFIILSMDISRVSWDPQVVADQISACPEDMLVRVTAAWMSRAVDLNQPAKMTGNDLMHRLRLLELILHV